MAWTTIPSMLEFKRQTGRAHGMRIGRADAIMLRVDAILQQVATHSGDTGYYLCACDLYFTVDYWLKKNTRATNPAYDIMFELFTVTVSTLTRIFRCTVNVLPRELDLTFGRTLSRHGKELDELRGLRQPVAPAELNYMRLLFEGGKAYRISKSNGGRKLVNSKDFHNPAIGFFSGFAGFVMSMSREIYIARHECVGAVKEGNFYHSSYFLGGPVMSAGSLWIENGVVKWICADSGHYQPHDTNMVSLLMALRMHGVSLAGVNITDYSHRKTLTAEAFLAANGKWNAFADRRDASVAERRKIHNEYMQQNLGPARTAWRNGKKVAPRPDPFTPCLVDPKTGQVRLTNNVHWNQGQVMKQPPLPPRP